MKKYTVFLLIVTGALAAILFKQATVKQIVRNIESSKSTSTKENIKRSGLPQKINIPEIGVNTNVELVGIDDNGRMEVPKDPNNVGWFEYGPRPGEIGSAVIAGHLDSKTGPAIFYKLSSLKINDSIEIIDQDGITHYFKVSDKKIYQDNNFPIDEVFTKSDSSRLNLITCAGTYDKVAKNYNNRMVIFGTLTDTQ